MKAMEHQKIAEACDILFGEHFRLEKDTFNYLQVSGIKSAYREKVKTCHPDLIGSSDGRGFCELKEAYDYLINLKSTPSRSGSKNGSWERYYDGLIPSRKLRLGEYLYYSGTISWNMLIDAIVWHKRNSRRIGSYFLSEKLLNTEDLTMKIIKMNIHNKKHR